MLLIPMSPLRRLPLRPFEEMPRSLLSCALVGHNRTAHLVVLLKHPDYALKECLRERAVDDMRWNIAHHIEHLVVKNLTVHPLEAQEVFARGVTMSVSKSSPSLIKGNKRT
ncbi:hypothetical protein M8756_16190 [Lutimaribacter sp. EGI FJ00015]|nr:hypothetical protein [Lutimaribacter sp. EGI FJ00015]MCO0637526.1 hypothetical protein [Lutimaribacter sp. EGI FJ00014]